MIVLPGNFCAELADGVQPLALDQRRAGLHVIRPARHRRLGDAIARGNSRNPTPLEVLLAHLVINRSFQIDSITENSPRFETSGDQNDHRGNRLKVGGNSLRRGRDWVYYGRSVRLPMICNGTFDPASRQNSRLTLLTPWAGTSLFRKDPRKSRSGSKCLYDRRLSWAKSCMLGTSGMT